MGFRRTETDYLQLIVNTGISCIIKTCNKYQSVLSGPQLVAKISYKYNPVYKWGNRYMIFPKNVDTAYPFG